MQIVKHFWKTANGTCYLFELYVKGCYPSLLKSHIKAVVQGVKATPAISPKVVNMKKGEWLMVMKKIKGT